MFPRRQRALIAWIATLAILLNALVPTVAHALTLWAGMPPLVIEVCSTEGRKLIKLDQLGGSKADKNQAASKTGQSDNSQAKTGEHCPYCLTHAGSFALPIDTAASGLILPSGKSDYPFLFYRSHSPLFAWAVANPRAPPTHS